MNKLMIWRDEPSAEWGRKTMSGLWHLPIHAASTGHRWDEIIVTNGCAQGFASQEELEAFVGNYIATLLAPGGKLTYL